MLKISLRVKHLWMLAVLPSLRGKSLVVSLGGESILEVELVSEELVLVELISVELVLVELVSVELVSVVMLPAKTKAESRGELKLKPPWQAKWAYLHWLRN